MAPVFSIGPIPVHGDVILAPMDGISDLPFRWLCRRIGSAITISEFVNVLDVPRELNDFKQRTAFTESERPFGFQIYGLDPKAIQSAAMRLSDMHPDFIDLNLGCSVRRIANKGAGAGLLQAPKKVRKIIRLLVRSLYLPVTVKLRLGWEASRLNFLEIGRIAEGEGAAMLTLHARARDQHWDFPAQWEAIAALKKAVTIPVVGNGDVRNAGDIHNMQAQTGCDAVMVGRAALGNPWIFAKVQKETLATDAVVKIITLHWNLMQAHYGVDKAKFIFKKHLKAYMDCPQFGHLDKQRIINSENSFRQFLLCNQ